MEKLNLFCKKYCNWGVKRKLHLSKDQPFDGFTAPIWQNASPRFFFGLFLWAFILFLVFVIVLAAALGNAQPCKFNYKILLVLQVIVIAADCILEITFFLKKYASDQQWSRYLIWLSITFAILILLGVVSMIIGFSEAGSTTSSCPNGISSSPLWQANIAFAVNIFVFSFGKLGLIIYFTHKYYRGNTMLAFQKDKQLVVVNN